MTDKIIARVALSPDDYYNILWALETLLLDLDKKFGDSEKDNILETLFENKKSINKTVKTVERGLKV